MENTMETNNFCNEMQITDAQYAKLQKFRVKVQDVLLPEHDDYYLVTWLIARQFDMKKAEEMLRNHMALRKEYDVDNILENWTAPEVIMKYDIGNHMGFTKEGHPFWIYRFCELDAKGVQLSCSRRSLLKRYIWVKENGRRLCRSQSKKLGKRIDKSVIILDVDKIGIQFMLGQGFDTYMHAFRMLEENYPETIFKTIVVNAGGVFPLVFNIVKPFMHQRTKDRMCVYSKDFRDKLLELIDADQLPVYWGGSRVDPVTGDEFCSSEVRLGGKVPEEYYLKNTDLVGDSLVSELTVPASQVSQVEYKAFAGKTMRYTFWTDNYDIKFGLFRKCSDGSLVEEVRTAKYNASVVPEDHAVTCDNDTTYVFVFDNTYSWIHSKHVYYAIQQIIPEVEIESTKL